MSRFTTPPRYMAHWNYVHGVCVSQICGCFVHFSLLQIIFLRICRRPFPNSVRYIIRAVFNHSDAETNTRHENGHGSIRQNTQATASSLHDSTYNNRQFDGIISKIRYIYTTFRHGWNGKVLDSFSHITLDLHHVHVNHATVGERTYHRPSLDAALTLTKHC